MRKGRLFEQPPAHSVRWWLFDIAVTLVAGTTAVPPLIHHDSESVAVNVAVVAAMTLPLLVRRMWPVPVFCVLLVAAGVAAAIDIRLAANLSLVIGMFTVAATRPQRQALAAAGLLEVGMLAAVGATATDDWWNPAILCTGMVASALGLGLYAATHRAYLTELQDRATRLELERDQREALAAAAERARLTRDMHDILAHNLAVIVALSDGAAAAVATTPERAAEAMRTVSSTGRQALSDIRRLLGASPDDPSAASRHPAPDIHGLEALVETVRAAGLPVTYEVQGSRAALDPSAQVTVYRLVQEALTNSLKHGGHGTTATVRLHYLPGEVHLDIEDDGAGAAAPAPDTLGRGLSGMRERVHAFNGALQSGPRSPRGWRVSATLRVDEAAR